ncbi:MAG TPA: PAS domain-containing protein, partial [Labilithrix sp.]|nr:PAS domain-containing protein [Labilithrix sp.]
MPGGGTSREVDRLALMAEVLRSFADATTDYPRLLQTIAERTASFLHHYCSVRLLSEDHRSLVTAASFDPCEGDGPSITTLASKPLVLEGSSVLRNALAGGKSVLMVEIPTDELTMPFEEADRDVARGLDIRSVIVAPLSARGETFGALFILQRGPGTALDHLDLELGEALATHAALAISNARMLEQLSREVDERKQMQSSLAMVELARQHEKSIVDTISQPLVVLDAEQKIRDANRTFLELFRTSDAEIKGRPFVEIAGGAFDTPRMRELLTEVIPVRTGALVTDVQIEVITPTLGRRTMLVNARKMYRPGNGTDTLLLALDDVTERNDAAEKLQRRALLLESMSEAVIAGDLRFRIEEWNPAAERLFGWTAGDHGLT